MSIVIKEVKTQKEIKQFAKLPYQLYKNHPYWVPQLISDEVKSLMPEHNPAFDFCQTKFWLAYKNGTCVGRIGGIINPLLIEKTEEKIARFTRVEFIDDEAVADALFSTVIAWAKENQSIGINGPLGFSNLDHQGLLIEGHDHLASAASDYHFDYYKKHYDRLGFEKEIDWLEFRITFPDALPDKALRVEEMIKKRFNLTVVEFESRKEMDPYKERIFTVFNQAFGKLYGTYPLPEKMTRYYMDKYFPILNPKFVKVILDKDQQLAGFVIAMPSLSEGLQKAKGKLFPFGWWHLKKAMDNTNVMDLMLTGVLPEYQKMGLVALLMNDLWRTAQKAKIKHVETTAMLENNNAIQLWKSFDHIQHKRKRAFKKMF